MDERRRKGVRKFVRRATWHAAAAGAQVRISSCGVSPVWMESMGQNRVLRAAWRFSRTSLVGGSSQRHFQVTGESLGLSGKVKPRREQRRPVYTLSFLVIDSQVRAVMSWRS